MLSDCSVVKTQSAQIGPKDALCALFLMIRESGRPNLADLAARLGTRQSHLERIVRGLRRQGLVQGDSLGLTFPGLATAASLLPQHRLEHEDRHLTAAA